MSKEMQHSLLDDPIISLRFSDNETRKTNLPEILTALTDDKIVSFEALQPHQHQPWYSFLVQLAAMAVARENDGDIPSKPDIWRKTLIGLADGSEAAWHLVVEDVSKPAFMQSPIPEGSLDKAGYKSDIATPDELDMLVTSKNHDIKGNRIMRPQPQHWLFALLTLQTMEGYSGPKNYGIARMNGGSGNRPFTGLTPSLNWGSRFMRDFKVLLSHRTDLLDMYSSVGFTLLWKAAWDGKKESGIPLYKCDPFFIEICRRIRFKKSNTELICYRNTTDATRIKVPDNLNGRTNDPWTPIIKENAKVLTIGDESGFTYDLIQDLLLGNAYKKPIALDFQKDEEGNIYFIAIGLVRGQGKTYGLHKRVVPISTQVLGVFKNQNKKQRLAKRSRKRVALASEVQKDILKPAIRKLIQGGVNQKTSRKQTIKENEQIKPWLDRFDREIDRRFFESLWNSVKMEPEEAKRQWEEILLEEAEKQFKEAERSTPIAQLRRLRAVSSARSIFYGRAREVLEFAGPQAVSAN